MDFTKYGLQDNDVFNIKDGKYYVEKWTSRGNAVGDALVRQRVTGMPPGRYRLKAAAQNIQEDTPGTVQTGAWIFANAHQTNVNVRADYTLEFVLVSDVLDFGFKTEGATGNWIAADNFRLEYIGDNFDDVKAEFSALVDKAEQIVDAKMNDAAHNALSAAIAAAKQLLNQTTVDGWGAAASNLEAAYAVAQESIIAFSKLDQAITEAQAKHDALANGNKVAYQEAIDAARATYNDVATTDAQALAAIETLAQATFAFMVENGSGTQPTVKTDTRFVRGATWAFGRSTVTGSNILETGFCWSENPEPKVTDNRTTEYINQAGQVYWLRNLKPATVYYMRAYAITKNYAVGYGDVIKFVTVPKGTIGHWYNNGGDEETNNRLNYAIDTSMDYYWNNLSSIHGFGISVTYSPGTQTADCSYGGSMRVGASASYQQVGTIMHEALHGIGVGTHGNWWSGDYRVNGVWIGDRVTEALRFWDNNTDGVISGDDMHLWPYGCNGAHEDTHNDNLYCMMGILAQALNEDGLPGSGEIGYALPYYAFNQEDNVKYYIKNEDPNRGLLSAYLVETASHALEWKTMNADEAAADDAAAWYISFTPSNQYYQLRNAASGYYMTYSDGIKTASHSKPTSADNFHLMRGRVDVNGYRGYNIIHPESSANPPCLNAAADGKTETTQWTIANSATTLRWLILTAEEALNFENGNIGQALADLNDLIARIRQLAKTPHSEDVAGADATLEGNLTDIESQAAACTKSSQITALKEQALTDMKTFLSCVSVTDMSQPFDISFLIENPDFDTDVTTGWTTTNGAPNYDAQGAEFYEKTFSFYQILSNMPPGNYQLKAYAFQRPGSYDEVLAPFQAGTARVTTKLFINSVSANVKHICEDRQSKALFNDGGWGSDRNLSDGTYIPNCMVGAEKYFAKGLYDSSVSIAFDKTGSLRIGIRCTSAPTSYWTMFDHFRLYFYGQSPTPDGIETIGKDYAENGQGPMKVYDLQGRMVGTVQQTNGQLSLSGRLQEIGLPNGIYIMNGKKVVVSSRNGSAR